MKRTVRILSLLLCLCFLTLAFASCGDDPADTTTAGPTTTRDPSLGGSKWDDVNFANGSNKKEIIIELNKTQQAGLSTAGADTSVKFIVGPDEITENTVETMVYQRNQKVANDLGITISYKQEELAFGDILSHLEQLAAQGGDTCPDIVVNMYYGLIRAEVNGLLKDMKDGYGTATNYFDFTSDGWYTGMMDGTTLNPDKYYIAAGDYFIDSLRLSFNAFVNVSKFDDTFASEGGMDALYDIILGNNPDVAWTYETMFDFADRAYVPNNLDESQTFWGLLSSQGMYSRAFFFSSNMNIFSYDANHKPSYVSNADAQNDLHTYVDALVTYMGETSVKLEIDSTCLTSFQNGNALFMTDQYLASLEGDNFRNMNDAAAVIPYPKYDASKAYRSLVSDNACGGAILEVSSRDFTACSALMQYMTEESVAVADQYFNVDLKLKNNAVDNTKQLEVLDIIRASVACPQEFLFDNYCARSFSGTSGSNTGHTIYDIIQVSLNATNQFSSIWNSEMSAKNTALHSAYNTFNTQN